MIKQLNPQIRRLLLVFGLLTLSLVLSPNSAAAQIDTGQAGQCSTQTGTSTKTFPDCAAELQVLAPGSSGGLAYGKWEGLQVVAYHTGEVYWAVDDGGQYRWQLYNGQLPPPAQEVTLPEAAPVEAAPVEAAPVEAAPVEPAPVEAAPVEAAPASNNPQTDQDQDGILDGTDQCPTQAEVYNNFADGDGCPDSLEELVDLARQNVDQYWRQVFANAQVPYYSPNAVMGYRGTIQTECGTALPKNAFYCFINRTIYYDIDFVQDQLLTVGDFAPVVIIAHEWGHFIQHQIRIWHLFTIQAELQADCFAGAYAQHANQVGHLQQGDLEEGASSLYNAGDYAAWFEPGAHGSPEQRRDKFMRGFNEGLGACF
jgi:predicted metalloprotease